MDAAVDAAYPPLDASAAPAQAAAPTLPAQRGAVPLLHVSSFTKHFGEVKANTDVSLEVQPGEVHALVGENGAGKSTLLKMIYGVYTPDSGEMTVNGARARPGSPADARALGIGMVFQDLRLAPALTVYENIALALPHARLAKPAALVRQIDEASARYGLAVHSRAKVRHLSIGERQRVEILKVLMTGARLIILDEPTSVLAPQEVDALFEVVRGLREQGFGIVIVTHKLPEVRAIADRMTVLRGGRTVLTNALPADYTDSQLIEAMVGREVSDLVASRAALGEEISEFALEMQDIRAAGDRGHLALKGLSLTVRRGELVGVAGVAGSGQRELCEVALGLRPPTEGTVRIGGRAVRSPEDSLAAGAASIPEDPVADSVVTRLTVLEHMVLDGRRFPRRRLGLDWRSIRDRTEAADQRIGLRMAPRHRRVSELSGGNIQRVVLTRELSVESSLVVAAYPSRGLDVANVRRTQEVLLDRRDSGAGVLMLSEDLDELMAMADRIVVMHDGAISGELAADEFDRQRIGQLMVGGAA